MVQHFLIFQDGVFGHFMRPHLPLDPVAPERFLAQSKIVVIDFPRHNQRYLVIFPEPPYRISELRGKVLLFTAARVVHLKPFSLDKAFAILVQNVVPQVAADIIGAEIARYIVLGDLEKLLQKERVALHLKLLAVLQSRGALGRA